MKKVIAGVLLIHCFSLSGRMAPTKHTLHITQDSIASYRDHGFKKFIRKRKKQFLTGKSISDIPLIGPVFDWGLSALQGVDMDKAKKFFARISEEKNTFNAQMKNFEQDDTNIAYLKEIFNQMTPEMITAKSTSGLSQAIENTKEQYFPNSKTMYTKDQNNKYTYASDTFSNYALCNLIAAHIVNQSSKKTSPRRGRRRNFKTSSLYKESHEKNLFSSLPFD